MAYKILLMGPQGSGKGTQGELMSEKMNIPVFGMGQLIRDEVETGSEHGQKLKEIIVRGDLISDKDAAELLKLRLARPDVANGYILDGYPRNMAQFGEFTFDQPTHLVLIEIPREESLKRIGGRLTCRGCSKVYAMSDGFKIGDTCECGGELYQRDDDTEQAVLRRLEIYEEDTAPVVEKYEQQGIVHRIDGMGSVEEVQQRIMKLFE